MEPADDGFELDNLFNYLSSAQALQPSQKKSYEKYRKELEHFFLILLPIFTDAHERGKELTAAINKTPCRINTRHICGDLEKDFVIKPQDMYGAICGKRTSIIRCKELLKEYAPLTYNRYIKQHTIDQSNQQDIVPLNSTIQTMILGLFYSYHHYMAVKKKLEFNCRNKDDALTLYTAIQSNFFNRLREDYFNDKFPDHTLLQSRPQLTLHRMYINGQIPIHPLVKNELLQLFYNSIPTNLLIYSVELHYFFRNLPHLLSTEYSGPTQELLQKWYSCINNKEIPIDGIFKELLKRHAPHANKEFFYEKKFLFFLYTKIYHNKFNAIVEENNLLTTFFNALPISTKSIIAMNEFLTLIDRRFYPQFNIITQQENISLLEETAAAIKENYFLPKAFVTMLQTIDPNVLNFLITQRSTDGFLLQRGQSVILEHLHNALVQIKHPDKNVNPFSFKTLITSALKNIPPGYKKAVFYSFIAYMGWHGCQFLYGLWTNIRQNMQAMKNKQSSIATDIPHDSTTSSADNR